LLIEKVRGLITKQGLLVPGDRLLVAFSGGPDSTCALLVLSAIWNDVAAAYVNHRLRGAESEREEQHVRTFCKQRGIRLFCEGIDWARTPSNLEEEARKRRYRRLEKVARNQGYNKVAIAHHKDDVVETFLLRLIRGSGPAGLSGLAVRRGRYIRPLLECSRKEILEYLSSTGVTYFRDSSNEELSHQRNRLRRDLIPYVEKHFNPAFGESILRASRWLREQNEVLDTLLKPYDRMMKRTGSDIRIARRELAALSKPIRKNVLLRALAHADPTLRANSRMLDRLLSVVDLQQSMELPGFLMVESSPDSIVLTHKTGAPGHFEVDVPGPGSYPFPPGKAVLRFTVEKDPNRVRFSPEIAFLDANSASFPLHIRNWKRGDSFIPLGMSGRKKLSDFFIDRKIPREQRKRVALVLKDDRLLWVAGYQIDHGARITEKTDRVLKIELRRENA
jgi:tRNA(Ile)-lysidine synthase